MALKRICLPNESFNLLRLREVVSGPGTDVLHEIIKKHVNFYHHGSLEKFINLNLHNILGLKNSKNRCCKCGFKLKPKDAVNRDQWDTLFEENNSSPCGFSARKNLSLLNEGFDVTLCALLILKLKMIDTKVLKTVEGVEDAVKEFRCLRNKISHMRSGKPDNEEFELLWTKISKALELMSKSISCEFFKSTQKNIDIILLEGCHSTKQRNKHICRFPMLALAVMTVTAVASAAYFVKHDSSDQIPTQRNTTDRGDMIRSIECSLFNSDEDEMAQHTKILLTGDINGFVGNKIVGKEVFDWSLVKSVERGYFSTTERFGHQVFVISLPNIGRSDGKEDVIDEVMKECNRITSLGVHVVEISRYHKENAKFFDELFTMYGSDIKDYVTVAFLGTERLARSGLTMNNFVRSVDPTTNLGSILMSDEYVSFAFNSSESEVQVKRILEIINKQNLQSLKIVWLPKADGPFIKEADESNETGAIKKNEVDGHNGKISEDSKREQFDSGSNSEKGKN